MRNIAKTALVPFAADRMFDLVDDIDAYASFLPWCSRSEVTRRDGELVEAELEISKGNAQKTFATRNRNFPHERIEIGLLSGPFRHLQGGWHFESLGEDGCKVSLILEFEFESRMIDIVFGAFFEETCGRLIDAFVARAEELYGSQQW